jgi:acyl carrier protein
MKERLINILEEIRPDIDFSTNDLLIDDGVLDSFDIVVLVGELNDAFGIDIGAADLQPENFNTIDAILALIEGLKNN